MVGRRAWSRGCGTGARCSPPSRRLRPAGRPPELGPRRPAPGRAGARRGRPPAAVRMSPRELGGRRGCSAQARPRLRPAPPSRPAGPPPPRRAVLRPSGRLCNVSSRSGGDASGSGSGSGRGPAVAASAAGPGGSARREPAATSLPPGRCGRLCAPRRGARTPRQPGRAQRTAGTGLPGLRPGTGPATASRAASPPRLRFSASQSRGRSGPRHLTAATQRPASALAAGSAAPRPPAVARAAPR